jgi:hypothetical protein
MTFSYIRISQDLEHWGGATGNFGRNVRLDKADRENVVTNKTVVWAIAYFVQYKNPGMDETFPALMQER